MTEQKEKKITVGLFQKNEMNKMEDYADLTKKYHLFLTFEGCLQNMKDNPDDYFNFGFTFNDFKAYLLKMTYCRAVRRFIEQKRFEQITLFGNNDRENYEKED